MKKSAVLICLSLALYACDSVNTVEPANPSAQRTAIADKRVITDSTLNGIAYLKALNVAQSGGRMRIQAEVQNYSVSPQKFHYKYEWFDKDGMIISSPLSAWKSVVILGHESLSLSEVAPTPDAVDFRLKISPDMKE